MIAKRKRLYGRIFLGLTLALIVFLFAITLIRIKHNKIIAKQIKNIPELKILRVNENDENWLGSEHQIIIIFYNSTCQNCHYEIESIRENLTSFNNANLLFISDESKEKIAAFSKMSKLNNRDNIWWLKMQPEDVYKNFGNISIPHILIYSKEGQLLKEYKGVTKVDVLLEYL